MNDKMTARILDWANRQTGNFARTKKAHERKHRMKSLDGCVCVCVCVLMMNAILIHSVTNARKNYFITNFANYIIKVMGCFYLCILHRSASIFTLPTFLSFDSHLSSHTYFGFFFWHFYCTHLHWLENRLRVSFVAAVPSTFFFLSIIEFLIILKSFIYGKYCFAMRQQFHLKYAKLFPISSGVFHLPAAAIPCLHFNLVSFN